jgi:uncharacterized membrane protein
MKNPLYRTLFCVFGMPILQLIAYIVVYDNIWVTDMKVHAHKRFLFFGVKICENLALLTQFIIFVFLYFGLLVIMMLVKNPQVRILVGLILISAIACLCTLQFPNSIWGLAFCYNLTFNVVFFVIVHSIFRQSIIKRAPNRFTPL